MLKRIFALGTAVIVVAGMGVALAGCGADDNAQSTTTAPTAQTSTATLDGVAAAFRGGEFEVGALNEETSPLYADYTDVGAVGRVEFSVNGENVWIYEFEASFDAMTRAAAFGWYRNGVFLIETESEEAIEFFAMLFGNA